MRKQERADLILKILEKIYPHPKIPLKHTSNYTLLISVLLSAQSTDVRVNLITPHLFKKAKTPSQMVKLTPSEIEAIIKPIGLAKTKSKAIHALSRKILSEFDGRVPNTLEDLESLPGVGHKTASVVMCQVFKKPAFPVDTHIHRCAKRWKLSPAKNVAQTERDLKKLFPKKTWIKLHLQIIYFAREHCPARGHNKDICPICSQLF